MEDTHAFRRDELQGDPKELRSARHSAAPRHGLSESALSSLEASEPTRALRDSTGPGPTGSARSGLGQATDSASTWVSRPPDAGTRADRLSSSADDAVRIQRAFGDADESGEDLARAVTRQAHDVQEHGSPPDDDPFQIYRRPGPTSHPVTRDTTTAPAEHPPTHQPGSQQSAAEAAASRQAPEAPMPRPPEPPADAHAAATLATDPSTPLDPDPESEPPTGRRSRLTGGGHARRGAEADPESFREGRYSVLQTDEDDEIDDDVDSAEQASSTSHSQATANHRRRSSFGTASLWTVLGAIIPGLGLLHSRVHGRRRLGLIIVGLVLVAVTAIAIEAVTDPAAVASVAVRPRLLRLISWGLPIGALVLVALLVFTHVDIRPRRITRPQRWVSSLLVGALSLMIAAPLTVGGRYANDEAAALANIFKDKRSGTRPSIDTDKSVNDILNSMGRVNVLLVGGDDSSSRNYRAQGEMNTDTMMVASIDTRTGNTSIIQVPRNTAKIPFPKNTPLHKIYPDGFTNGDGDDANFFANALWTTVQNDHKDAMGNTDYPGADALKEGIGAALNLHIDYFMMLDIDGLQKFITAIDGVTVNVNERIPIAGDTEGKPPTGYIEPGPDRHLNGYQAMWYARSRSASTDYDRMGRQSCLIKAVLDQVSPQIVLTKFESIADASGQMVVSDIPQKMLPVFVELALRVRTGNLNRLLFTIGRNGFQPYDPDYGLIRKQVKETITEAGNTANKNKAVTSPTKPTASKAPASKAPAPKPTTAAPTPAASSAKPSAVSQSVTDVCAYHPAG